MKTRTGFVSNSSSTAFCIIGVDRWAKWAGCLPEVIWEMDGRSLDKEEMWASFSYGYEKGKHFDFYGYDTVDYVGVDAEKILEHRNINEAKQWFRGEVMRLYRIDIPTSIVKLHYGESGE